MPITPRPTPTHCPDLLPDMPITLFVKTVDGTGFAQWPFVVPPTEFSEIHRVIASSTWQTFRISLKGISTYRKLYLLYLYLFVPSMLWHEGYKLPPCSIYKDRVIQVANYINALRRGGQLVDPFNTVAASQKADIEV